MYIKKVIFSLVTAVVMAICGHAVMANSLSTSGPGFQAMSPADAPYIQHTGYAVYNTDTANAHGVTAPAGLPFIVIDPGTTDYTFHAAVYNNGGTLNCTAYLINLGSFTTYSGTNSTTVTGGTILDFNVSVTTATSGTVYAPAIACTLPASNGTTGNGTIFGVYSP